MKNEKEPCTKCGELHNPDALTVVTLHRYGWEAGLLVTNDFLSYQQIPYMLCVNCYEEDRQSGKITMDGDGCPYYVQS